MAKKLNEVFAKHNVSAYELAYMTYEYLVRMFEEDSEEDLIDFHGKETIEKYDGLCDDLKDIVFLLLEDE